MSEWQVQLLLAKYGPWCMAYAMFYPAFRDFVQGFMIGLLGA